MARSAIDIDDQSLGNVTITPSGRVIFVPANGAVEFTVADFGEGVTVSAIALEVPARVKAIASTMVEIETFRFM